MAGKQKILIVDDDENIANLVSLYLTKECFDTRIEHDGNSALVAFRDYKPDLVLLDLMLPGIDGYEVCREIRKTSKTPIIMLSAKDSEFDKVIGLEIGADDYVTKPFSNRELLARVKAHLRRTENIETAVAEESAQNASSDITIGELQILPDAFIAKKRGEEIELTHREFELLHHLATHIGQVMTREHLLETVWGYDYFGDVRTVDVTVRRLREKIEDTPGRPEYILTRRGVGYYMKSYE